MARQIALVVGDTPGHFYPALAVAGAYRSFMSDADALFLGPAEGSAADLAAQHGCRFEPIAGSPLVRVGAVGKIAAAGRSMFGIAQARRVLRAHGARLVMGFGGYVSGGVVVAARTLGVGTAIHEGNVRPGLANRLLARATDRVYLHFADAARYFPADRVRVTGWPVRNDARSWTEDPRDAPTTDRPTRVLVMDGARGDDFLARQVPALLGRLAARGISLEVLHQVGGREPDAVRRAYERAQVPAITTPLIERMDAAYGWADFSIARAGAGTIAELAIAGIPALLVPLPDAAEDHQTLNAETFARRTGGLWAREADWDEEDLASRIALLFSDPRAWRAVSDGARRLAVPDAANKVVADCEEFMRGRW